MNDMCDYDVLWPAVCAPVAQVPTVQAPVAHVLQNPLPQLVLPMSAKNRVANIETRGDAQRAPAIPSTITQPPVVRNTEVPMFDISSDNDEDADNEGDVPSNRYGDNDDSDDDWPHGSTLSIANRCNEGAHAGREVQRSAGSHRNRNDTGLDIYNRSDHIISAISCVMELV
jgi:hypothetical protein